jgi:hypothetical protein
VTTLLADDPELMRRSLPGETDEAFIESFRNARRDRSGNHVKALISTTSSWKMLLPDDPAMRAEVLHQMSLRHEMPRNKSKKLAAAFGVGTASFDQAYRSTVGSEVDTAFAPDRGILAALRRRRS